jgi:hypothetical protein
MSTLFRPESLAAKNGSWLGTVRLNQPISYWVVATTSLVVSSLYPVTVRIKDITVRA